MPEDHSSYKHDASDRKLDKAATADEGAEKPAASRAHPGHDAEEISRHDDTGKDRMFEGREQHDKADLKSEKNRLAKDTDHHKHPVDGADAVTEANMHVKRKE
ncbi:MAG: hypothetical protein ABIW79_03310 [Gemmatimonas sp.]